MYIEIVISIRFAMEQLQPSQQNQKQRLHQKSTVQPIKEEEDAPRELPSWKQKPTMHQVLKDSIRPMAPVKPLKSLAHHYQMLQNEYTTQK